MLTLDIFYLILRQIVIDFPYQETGRLSTFAVLDREEDLLAESLNRNYADFEAGYFWSRAWANGGALDGELQRDGAILFAEHKTSVYEDYSRDTSKHEVYITLCDTIDEKKSLTGLDSINYKNITAVLQSLALYTYGTYNTGEEEITGWIDSRRLAANEWSIIKAGYDLIDFMPIFDVQISTTNFASKMLRGKSARLNVEACEGHGIDLNYLSDEGQSLGVIICQNCAQ